MQDAATRRYISLGGGRMSTLIGYLLRYGIYVAFVILVLILSLVAPRFLTWGNWRDVLMQVSVVGTIALGQTFVILVRGIDVSVGSIVLASSALSLTWMSNFGLSPGSAVLLMVVCGTLIGAVNGFAVAYLRMPAFVVTLATYNIFQGLGLTVTGGTAIYKLPKLFEEFGLARFGPLPAMTVVFLICSGLAYIGLSKTVFGRQVYAVGSNPTAARVSGINVKFVTFMAFVIVGLFSGIAAIVITARMDSFYPQVGTDYQFDSIAAVVIGGTSLAGGVGGIGGTILGILMMGVINNALNLLNVSAYWQLMAKGSIIFLAVLIDAQKVRASSRR